MEIRLAAHAGFCFGVDRAVNMAVQELEKGPLYSLGSIIHNQSVMDRLKEQGLICVDTVDEIKDDRPVIIRSHGAGPGIYSAIEDKGLRIVDTTCPYVKRLHNLIQKYSNEGRRFSSLRSTPPEVSGSVAWGNEHTHVLRRHECGRVCCVRR